MIVKSYYNLKILTEPMILISVQSVKMLCKNVFYDAMAGKWIVEGERSLSEDEKDKGE